MMIERTNMHPQRTLPFISARLQCQNCSPRQRAMTRMPRVLRKKTKRVGFNVRTARVDTERLSDLSFSCHTTESTTSAHHSAEYKYTVVVFIETIWQITTSTEASCTSKASPTS